MYILLNWFLRNIPQVGIVAGGNIINNPKFYSGQNIFTTHSESNYIAKFEEINIEIIKEIEHNFELINIPNDYLAICKSAYKDKKDRLKNILEIF